MISMRHVATHQTEQSQTISLEQRQVVNFVQEQSLADVQNLLETLEQRGEINFDLLQDYDDEEQLEDSDEFDAEWDLSDEDAMPADDSSTSNEDYGDTPFMSRPEFEIRVITDETGHVRCVPPDNEWAVANAAKYSIGQKALYALDERYRTFEAIAKWLETEEGDLLAKGADVFLAQHHKIEQKIFCIEHDFNKSTFSRRINNVVLSWDDASIPLRALFSR